MKIHKRHIASHVSRMRDLPFELSQKVVQDVLDAIQNALLLHGKLALRGFGTWQIKKRGKKVGRHPVTGERINIPPKDVIAFQSSDSWDKKIDEMGHLRHAYQSISNPRNDVIFDACLEFVNIVIYRHNKSETLKIHAKQQILDFAGFDVKVAGDGNCSGKDEKEANKWMAKLESNILRMSEKDLAYYVADMVLATRKYKSMLDPND